MLGVKPVPEIVTPVVIVPATMLEAPSVTAGVPRIVNSLLAVLPAASVTAMTSTPAAVVDGTTNPTWFAMYKSPVALVTTFV